MVVNTRSSKVKGTLYVSMKKLVKAKGKEFEETFISQLSTGEKERYENVMNVSWVEIDDNDHDREGDGKNIVEVGAQMLFPGATDGIAQVGKAIGNDNLKGIYSIFFRIPKIDFILKRAAKVWRIYNSNGEASVEDWKDNTGKFIVTGFPTMSKTQRLFMQGYLTAVLEYTRAKNVRVKLDDGDPNRIIWHVDCQ